MDIQLILEFKNSFGKYHPVFPKKSLKVVFFRLPVYLKSLIPALDLNLVFTLLEKLGLNFVIKALWYTNFFINYFHLLILFYLNPVYFKG